MDMVVDLVQEPCVMAVPFFDFNEQRDMLENHWAERKGGQKLEEYWKNPNQVNIDGKTTRILDQEPAPTSLLGN